MREIKFRAWLKDGRLKNGGKMMSHADMEDDYGNVNVESSDVYQVMQYTGLKDKSGVDIYEGDYLEAMNGELYRVDELFPVHRHTHVTNVAYKSGKKYIVRNNPNAQHDNIDDWMSFPEEYEVVGNFYENPDLLGTQ